MNRGSFTPWGPLLPPCKKVAIIFCDFDEISITFSCLPMIVGIEIF